MKLDKSNIDRIEADIRPPMKMAISLPVQGMPGFCVYVTASPFSLGDQPFGEIQRKLKTIAANLTL